MQRFIILIILFFLLNKLFAQTEMSVFTSTGRAGVATTFVTDYQSIGINPANLGFKSRFEDKHVSLGLLEMSYSIFSEVLTKPELRESIKNIKTKKFTFNEKIQAGIDFTQSALAMNMDLLLAGFAVQPNKSWGFAFGVKERGQWYSKLNKTTSEILFLGFNAPYFDQKYDSLNQLLVDTGDISNLVAMGTASIPQQLSELMDGSVLNLSLYTEYNLSLGFRLVGGDKLSIYTGIGAKYLKGLAVMDIQASNGKIDAYSSISPRFNIDYGEVAALNPSSISQQRGLPKSVGEGLGFDIGINAVINEKFKMGIAINDIGSIVWDGNVYEANDAYLDTILTGGFNNYNLFKEAGSVLGEGGIFQWNGLKEKKTQLPTVIRTGASFEFADGWEIGVDAVFPFNESASNYQKGVYALGLEFTPITWIRLSTGIVLGGNYGFNLPVGVVIIVGAKGTWELGVASRDAVTFFTENRPTLSLSTGFLRFRF